MEPQPLSSMFELLPIGAYRSSPDGRMLRANAALVALNGYASEDELLRSFNDIAHQWYADPARRDEFMRLMARDGQVLDFVSEVHRHKTREKIWVQEYAHAVQDAWGNIEFYEGTVLDISASRRAQFALEGSEALLRQITSRVPGMVYRIVFGPDGIARYTFVSDGVTDLFRVSPQEVVADGAILRNLRHPDDQEWIMREVVQSIQAGTALSIEYRVLLPDGTLKWVHMSSSPAATCDEGYTRVGVMLDITARKLAESELKTQEERWKLALESTGDGLWDWHVDTGLEYFSDRFRQMYGLGDDAKVNHADILDELTHPEDRARMHADRQAHFSGQTSSYRNEHRVRMANGEWKWVLSRGMVISRDAAGNPLRMIGTHTDITERKHSENLIWQQAHFDPLTNLPNRRMMRQRLETALQQAKATGQVMALLFIDLDHFKEINDTLGHDHGDLLLLQAAQRIQACMGHQDTVARMGGDEFTVVMNEVRPSLLPHQLQVLLDSLSQGFILGGEQVFISASVGVALYPQDGRIAEDLLKHADQALYVSKGGGRNRYSFFKPQLQQEAQNRARLAADLRRGLALNQFEVVYQPIVNLATGQVDKAEALLRWHHPQRGLVSPAQFIGIAETTGMIIDIGDWVFRQAAAQVARWRQTYHPNFQISVNKSPAQFHAENRNHSLWTDFLAGLNLPGSCVAVEITEGLLLETSASVTEHLLSLRNAGVAVSLDDFGTGYSSLTYLQKFAIDVIKIDQAFVRNLTAGSRDLALCRAIITMAHALGMKVVAEGVETAEQRDLLLDYGCDYGQGYLYSRPLSVAAFEDYMSMRASPAHHAPSSL